MILKTLKYIYGFILDSIINFIIKATPTKTSVQVQFMRMHRQFPNLENPKYFSEMICARKLNWKDQRFVTLSDKVAVKDWVAEKIGEEFVIPNIYVANNLPPIDFRNWGFPYVIKANHGSGFLHMVRSSTDENWAEIEQKVETWLKTDWPKHLSEEWYNQIDKKILVEPIIGIDGVSPPDFKFFVFRGEIACIQVDLDRFTEHKRDFYSKNWELMPFSVIYKNSGILTEKPKHFLEMCVAAARLGEDFDFVRVDFYDTEAGPKFGEMTFAPGSGLETFSPKIYDAWLGQFWYKPNN